MMKYPNTFIFLLLSFYVPLMGQSFVEVSGVCKNQASGAPIELVSVYEVNSNEAVFSDSSGRYRLKIPKGRVKIRVSHVGYKGKSIEMTLTKDTTINFMLEPDSRLKEVEVVGKKIVDVVDDPQMGEIQINTGLVTKLPSLAGEQDIIKAVQLLPGVQNGEEGKSGLYVRGGGPGQNLILIEGIPIYDITHFGGFFSVFNTYAIEDMTLKKGSFPARYGGRLSSILDVKIKSGRKDRLRANAGVGLFSSKLLIDGPIKKGKSSFMLALRRTYPDLIYGPLYKKSENEFEMNGHMDTWKLHFWDLNLKTNFSLGKKSELSFFAFAGKDLFQEGYDFGKDLGISTKDEIRRGNYLSVLRWMYQFNKNLTLNTAAAFTANSTGLAYEQKTELEPGYTTDKNQFTTHIEDWTGKTDLLWAKKSHVLRTGISGIYHRFSPGYYSVFSDNHLFPVDTTYGDDRIGSMSFHTYLEDTWTTGRWKLNAGIHLSNYALKEKRHTFFEPRIAARYRLNQNWSIKAAYSKNVQVANLLVSDIGRPFDIWALSTKKIVPQKAYQTAVGVAMKNPNFECTVDVYYKKMRNVVANKSGFSFLDNRSNWEDRIVQGNGESYGSEFFLSKNSGRFTGWLGYTLSWSWRQFEAFNGGRRFPFKYDRRHDVKVALNYKKSEKVSFSAIWVYGTGNAVTLPIGYARIWPTTIIPGKYSYYHLDRMLLYSEKNAYREPAYHRLDLGVNFTKRKKRGIRTWSFGLYNAYAHANPTYLYVSEVQKENGEFDHYGIFRKTIFTLLPSISYSFKMY